MSDCYLNGQRTAELWNRFKAEFGKLEPAGENEVSEMLDDVFGSVSNRETAADEEVEEMLNDVFGVPVKNYLEV